jgi:Fic family protein
MITLAALQQLDPIRFEAPAILKKLASASRCLAELKGLVASIPHEGVLINTLGMQEAKDSSEIENLVTTHDELYQDAASPDSTGNPAAKEVLRYRQALWRGFEAVSSSGLLTNHHILDIQAELESNKAGFRKLPGTALRDAAGRVIYTPPSPELLPDLMSSLEKFINDPARSELDPLIRMALIHHQFETIHPFYDGNGRTGRIINVLYLVKEGLLDIPVLYLSRHIVRTKADYYRLLQTVRERDAWEEWVIYMLSAVENTAREAIAMVTAIKAALLDVKHRIREQHPKIYSQDLINNLFSHPYTKIEFIQNDLGVSRITATKYLEALTESGFLTKRKVGRSNYYVNKALNSLLTR